MGTSIPEIAVRVACFDTPANLLYCSSAGGSPDDSTTASHVFHLFQQNLFSLSGLLVNRVEFIHSVTANK